MKKPQQPRKPLRQRVAERKAGIEDEQEAAARRATRKRLRMIGLAIQVIAILLLIPPLYGYLSTGDIMRINWNWIIISFVVFIVGRVLNAWASVSGPIRW